MKGIKFAFAATVMETAQRIKELRMMFLQLAEIILEEMKQGKNIETSETYLMMKKVQEEIILLEQEKGISLN
jgi:hypothetical protein